MLFDKKVGDFNKKESSKPLKTRVEDSERLYNIIGGFIWAFIVAAFILLSLVTGVLMLLCYCSFYSARDLIVNEGLSDAEMIDDLCLYNKEKKAIIKSLSYVFLGILLLCFVSF